MKLKKNPLCLQVYQQKSFYVYPHESGIKLVILK